MALVDDDQLEPFHKSRIIWADKAALECLDHGHSDRRIIELGCLCAQLTVPYAKSGQRIATLLMQFLPVSDNHNLAASLCNSASDIGKHSGFPPAGRHLHDQAFFP